MNKESFEGVRWLIRGCRRGLSARSGEGLEDVLARLAEQDIGEAAFREPPPAGLPVLRQLPQAIGEVMLLDPDLAAAIASVEDSLWWRQSTSYTDAVLGEGFSDNYGWAEIIGPHGFFPGSDFLLGLLLLGPNRHYRDHYHPAPELYWPLTSGSLWSRDSGPFAEKQQGALIWHPPMAMHATRTGDAPLLAVWCWTHDTSTPARLK